jgi:hypothetical protein
MQWRHSSAVRATKCKSVSACWKAVASAFCAAREVNIDAAPHSIQQAQGIVAVMLLAT